MAESAQTQLQEAATLGTKAFTYGIPCTPYRDQKLMGMVTGRLVGETPDGEACSLQLFNSWAGGWHSENIKQSEQGVV